VDADRFAQELPRLFDDFPRSEHPRGRRFDDILEAVPNLATENTLALVNLAVSLLEPEESYLEAGTFMGASLIAAARGNEDRTLVAVDDFSFPAGEAAGRLLPAASRTRLEANLERFGVRNATILEGDTHEVLRSGALEGHRVGAYYYDACHSYGAQLDALRLVEPYLAARALLIVDDSDWTHVARATADYLAEQPRARMLVQVHGEDHGSPQWWSGMQVIAWQD
jgi:predicted O-methyltransferase YrrM